MTKARSKAKHRRVCQSKTAFDSRLAAERVAMMYGQTPYECKICKRWHNTSQVTWDST
jgi:hypothetical protein